MRNLIWRSMQDPDQLVVEFVYQDADGHSTRRIVSPIRFLSHDRFLGLCLCREAPRQFYLPRCRNMTLKRAAEFVMPVPIGMVTGGVASGEGPNVAST